MAARPASRAAPRSADVPARAPVRDLTRGATSFRIDWDVRPAYDFVFSLSEDAGATEDLPAEDRAWLTSAKAAMPADLRDSALQVFASEMCINSAVLVVDRPEVRTSADLVGAMASATPAEIIRGIFEYSPREPEVAALIDRALNGDEDAITALGESIGEHKKEGRLQLLRDPDASLKTIVDVLAAWAEIFGQIEPRVTEIIERDYDSRAADRASLTPVDLIERTTGGIRWLPEAGVRRVILAPSYFSRPYNFLMSAGDWRLFGYPVADAAIEPRDPLAAPQAVVRLHRALGDETRLRILKLLASRDLYLTEIAQQLDLSKPTIKHHLALLRAAGLVTITESGTVIYYSLRRNRLDDASADIKRFLIG
ncbi:MAG TPA: metalloregulator ArsR/SmtB family transcription factor [Candidatus Limnocylindrales bacterium]|nr:metalloregulator ArsR/SmtB family transcription factor [Candidatus Limnocylindrales bacterium]